MELLLLFLVIALVAGFGSGNKSSGPRGGGAIIGTGRSPMYYDIMDENYAEYEEKLRQDALAGKMITRTTFWWEDRNDPSKHVTTTISAQQVYDEFLKWKANGYM